MPYIRKIATINLNAISCRVKQHLLKEFVWNNDLDVVFMQEVAFENFSFVPTHTAVVNISEDGKGTGILLRNNISYTNLVMNTNGRITCNRRYKFHQRLRAFRFEVQARER